MKSAQIKTLLIILLLALNIFLIWNIVSLERGKNIPSEKSCENASELLEKEGVSVDMSVLHIASGDLPVIRLEGYAEAARQAAFRMLGTEAPTVSAGGDTAEEYSAGGATVTLRADQTLVYQSGAEPDSDVSPAAARRAALRFLKQAFPEADGFEATAQAADGGAVVTAYQLIGKQALRDERLTLQVRGGAVVFFSGRPALGAAGTTGTAKVKDALNAVFYLTDARDISGRSIKSVELCYVTGRSGASDSLSLVPAWFFTLDSGETLYFDQLTGTVQTLPADDV